MLERIREKHFETWVGGWLRHRLQRGRQPPGLKHLLFALCDHYEPLWSQPTEDVGEQRVRAWQEGYPRMAEPFRDADGRAPQHSFFFPGEEFRPRFFDRLEPLVRGGFGEVELHLHHDGATESSLREELDAYLRAYSERGHFSRDAQGRVRYAFIHGNWALCNGRPDGKRCGVDNELRVLFDTGCYADFTFPSAPDVCQPNIVNAIYWPTGDLGRKRAYEWGKHARVGERMDDRMLMIQGPLALAWRPGLPKPRIEGSGVTANDPGTPSRVRTWVAQHIHVHGRPDWIFVKLYTHGAPEKQAASLLGDGGRMLHRELCGRYNDGIRWKLHYVTAREMFNVAMAAIDGRRGDPHAYRDYVLPPPPIVQDSRRSSASHY